MKNLIFKINKLNLKKGEALEGLGLFLGVIEDKIYILEGVGKSKTLQEDIDFFVNCYKKEGNNLILSEKKTFYGNHKYLKFMREELKFWKK